MNPIKSGETNPGLPGCLKTIFCCISAALIGFMLVFGPVLAQPYRPKSLPEIYEIAVKNLSLGQTLLFAVAGTFTQLVLNPTWRFLVSMCSVAILPILAIAEMTADPTSHNLWPIEFLIYGVIGSIFYVGALLGSFVRRHSV